MLKKTLQIFIALIIASLIMELILQLIDPNSYSATITDNNTGLLTYLPNAVFTVSSRCYQNEVKTNSDGFYAPPYYAQKKPNVFRILVVGSSFVESVQMPLEKTFNALLQNELNKNSGKITYEVVPLAFSGNGTYLDLLYFINYGRQLKPNLIINLNTDFNNEKNSNFATYAPRFDDQGKILLNLPKFAQNNTIKKLKNILRRSKLTMNFYQRYLILKSNLKSLPPLTQNKIGDGIQTGQAPANLLGSNLWQIEEKILAEFNNISLENNAKFVLISWVSDLKDMAGHTEFGAKLLAIAAKYNFPYLNLQPIMLNLQNINKQEPYWACDGHWNDVGHKWAAENIYNFLTSHPKLLTPVNITATK